MAGIVTYEIAPPVDRAFELAKFVAAASGSSPAALTDLAAAKDFASFVSGVVDALESVARTSSDEGV